MLPTEHLLAFVVLATVLIVVPGPSVLFVVTRSLTLGRRAGLATVVGNAAGAYVQVVFVALGVGAIVQESIAVFTVIKLAGALYLVYLGVQSFRHRRELARGALHGRSQPRELRRMLADAFVVGVANPKVIVFFVAVLPQFVDPLGRLGRAAAADARRGLLRDRARLRRHLGAGRGRRAQLARALAAAPGGDRRHGRGRDDRPRRRPRRQRPQGLRGRARRRGSRRPRRGRPRTSGRRTRRPRAREVLAQAAGAAGGVGRRQVPEQHDLARRDVDDLDVVDARRIEPRGPATGARVEQPVAAVGLHARQRSSPEPAGRTGRVISVRAPGRRRPRAPRRRGRPRPPGSHTAGTSRTPRCAASAVASSSRAAIERRPAPLRTAAGCISHAAAAIRTLSGTLEVAAAGERLAEGGQRERDGAADLLGVRRGAHRERAVERERLRPAQRLQAAALGGAGDALEERLAVGLAAKALERVGAGQPLAAGPGSTPPRPAASAMTRSAARYASGLRGRSRTRRRGVSRG